ncbi:MAG: hypothetical protein M0P69_16425 [Bacteroidales bacterium]|nr:hypothetical protein [Bacteroidales bacterium]
MFRHSGDTSSASRERKDYFLHPETYDQLFLGYVTSQHYDHKRGIYQSELKDAVSTFYKNDVEFSAGTAGEVMEEIVSGAGRSFYYSGDVIDMYGTFDDPVLFVDVVKSISFAMGKYIANTVSGNWGFNAPETAKVIYPIEASSTLDLNRYANIAIITVDADWTEGTSTVTTTVETGYGISRTIKKIGDQLQSIDTDLGSGNGIEETWTWDEDGNLTRYDKAETASLEKVTSYTTWEIDSPSGLFTMFEYSVVERRPNPMADWFNYRKYEKTTTTYLDDNAPVNVEEYIFWYFQEVSQWHYKEWVHRVGLPQTPGIIESSRNDYYEYSEVDGNWYLQRTRNEGGLSRPEWTKMIQMDKIGIHFSATAEDESSINLFTPISREYSAFGLTSIEDVEEAAKNFLIYCQRANITQVNVLAAPYIVGDLVSWGGEEWIVEQVTHQLDSMITTLELSRKAGIMEVQESAFGDPNKVGTAIYKLLQVQGRRLNNAARGKIIAQVDYETYQVHIQGEATSKIRTARTDYHRGESFPPGKEVLLVRPSGKNSMWEIVTRRNDPPTVMSTVQAPAPPAPALEFFLGRTVYHPTNDALYMHIGEGYRMEVKWGYETDDPVRKYKSMNGIWIYDGKYTDGMDVTQDSKGCVIKPIYTNKNPLEYPSQTCTGSVRLMGQEGTWTDWNDFTYYIETPKIQRFDWTEGTAYAGTSLVDVPSALVKDVTFTIACDFRSILSTSYFLEWSEGTENWGELNSTSAYFRLKDTTTAVPMTGYYLWNFSVDGLTWHTTPTIYDVYLRVGNNADGWTDGMKVPTGDEFYFKNGMGYAKSFKWFDNTGINEKDENGNLVFTETMRLGYSGLNLLGDLTENFGPPYPRETVEYVPNIDLGDGFSWTDPSE